MQSIGTNVSKIGAKASDTVRRARSRIAKGADMAVSFVLERAGIKVKQDDELWQHDVMVQMSVIGACGRRVGVVEEVVEDCIKLAPAQGQYRQPKIIPWNWIERVDSRVHLNRDYEEATRGN